MNVALRVFLLHICLTILFCARVFLGIAVRSDFLNIVAKVESRIVRALSTLLSALPVPHAEAISTAATVATIGSAGRSTREDRTVDAVLDLGSPIPTRLVTGLAFPASRMSSGGYVEAYDPRRSGRVSLTSLGPQVRK